MARDIRLIGLDLDGTTFNTQKEIVPVVAGAIEEAIRAGIVVLPATGRQLQGVPKEFLAIPGVRYALVSNGARVYDLTQKEPIYSDVFDEATAIRLIEFARGFDCLLSAYIGDEGYTEGIDFHYYDGLLPPKMVQYMHDTRQLVPDLIEVLQSGKEELEKFSIVFKDPAERQRCFAAFLERDDCTTTSSMPQNIEVNTSTANKGAGLLALGKMLGIERAQIMAIGDGLNDIEMLQTVGYGVAMGNAEPEVLAAADAVTACCDEAGVAAAIHSVMY